MVGACVIQLKMHVHYYLLPQLISSNRMWMKTACRDLTNYQWRLVANAIGQCSLPIFVKLVFAEICRWRSYTKPQDTVLASTVMDSIMMLFERIEKQVSVNLSHV